jgi:MraZ protein
MLLTGTYERTLDDKNRLVFPARVREQLTKTDGQLARELKSMFVSPGLDQCLWLFLPEALETFSAKLEQTSGTDVEVRAFRRLFYGPMEQVDVDRAGRILIPQRLLDFAGMKREVTLLGIRDRLELWDSERWREYQNENAPRFDSVAERAFKK